MNSLKRQAAKAKRYDELKTEMVAYLRQVLAAKFLVLERETAKAAIELNLLSTELQGLQSTIATKEEEQAKIIEASYATDGELTEARKQLAAVQLDAERARGRPEYLVRQIKQIAQRMAMREHASADLSRQQ